MHVGQIGCQATKNLLFLDSTSMPKKYYAVKAGFQTGIFSFEDARDQIRGYSNPDWKGFNVRQDAVDYLKPPTKTKPQAKVSTQTKPNGSNQKKSNGVSSTASNQPKKLNAKDVSALQTAKVDADRKARARKKAEKELIQRRKDHFKAEEEVRRLLGEVDKATLHIGKCSREMTEANQKAQGLLGRLSHAPNSDKQKWFYIVGDSIFDHIEMARRNSQRTGEAVYTCDSLELARAAASCEGVHTYKEKFQQTISYVNDKGKRVYQMFTDGSCSDNGSSHAVAAFGVFVGENNLYNFSVYQYPVSSQAAELAGIRKAYLIIDWINDDRLYEICTDSSYSINCLTKWCHTWKKNGWKCEDGSRVDNQEAIQEIMEIRDRRGCRNVQLKKVKAHSTSEGNKQADKLARERIELYKQDWYDF